VDLDDMALDWVRNTRFNVRTGCGVLENEVAVGVHWVAAH
jgi:hypothetical protein